MQSGIYTFSLGLGAAIWLRVFPPGRATMRLLLGLVSIPLLLYGIIGLILENVDMKIPLWIVIILGGLIGALAAGWAWKESVKSSPVAVSQDIKKEESKPPQPEKKTEEKEIALSDLYVSNPKPLLRISYLRQEGNTIAIRFENVGDAPVNYFTVDITAKKGTFSVAGITAPFSNISVVGGMGTWATIYGKNVLPGQFLETVSLTVDSELLLNPPKVRSDSRYVFFDTVTVSIGPRETMPK